LTTAIDVCVLLISVMEWHRGVTKRRGKFYLRLADDANTGDE